MRFDHCYQVNPSADTFFALANRGFVLDEKSVDHPGELTCRFIRLGKTCEESKRLYQYLEFAEAKDPAALFATLDPGSPESLMWEQGFSLIADNNLEATFNSKKDQLNDSKPEFSHKNYDWKTDAVSKLPGWNFMTFGKSLIEGIFVWCTEYEDNPGTIFTREVPVHPNSVKAFDGFIWRVTPDQATSFATFAEPQKSHDVWELQDHTKIYFEPNSDLFKDKKSTFNAVVLTCTNWESFQEFGKPDLITEWRGQKVGIIRMPENAWDIVVRPV